MENKNVLLICDLPGYGKIALSAMLPILARLGYSVYNLPTALVSNALEYGKFALLDTTDYMEQAIQVWKELGFQFDCITTGFLASAAQVDLLRAFIDSQRKADFLVVTTDNPRTEDPEAIIADILPGLEGSGTPHVVVVDRIEAIHWVMDHAERGDVIVLCGKGHETYQEINHVKHHMDEREIVADYLEGRK